MPMPNTSVKPPMSILLWRSTALVLGVFAFVGMAAAQATQLDPARFAASIYADGREAAVWAPVA
jgi:hypothetical protein